MNCNMIHETVIRDIVDILNDVKNTDELKGLRGRSQSFRSIAQASSNMTLVFPVIVSTNSNIENASMVTKAIERKAVTMLQMLFSAISIHDNSDGIDYLKKFHNNLKLDNDVTVDDYVDALDKFVVKNEAFHISNVELYEKAKQDLKNLSLYLPDNINENSINDYVVSKNYYGESTVVLEKKDSVPTPQIEIKPNMNIKYNGGGKSNYSNNTAANYKGLKDQQDLFRNQLMTSDVKKANELVPTMMTVNFISTEYDENITSQMIIGVKAKMYPVDSTDLITRISSKHVDRNGMMKFIKATTREISFVRDFLFAIDKAKIDALSSSRKGSSSKMWKILERRALKSKLRRNLGQVNDASAITTIVITQEEVEYLKKSENIDVEDPNVIRPILEAYNLMGFAIIDDSLEVCKFIFDTGNDIYESVSFTHLERESNDGGYKKVVNLMTKMR